MDTDMEYGSLKYRGPASGLVTVCYQPSSKKGVMICASIIPQAGPSGILVLASAWQRVQFTHLSQLSISSTPKVQDGSKWFKYVQIPSGKLT